MDTDKIKSFTQPIGTEKISHLSFADDVLIFCNGSKGSLINLNNFLNTYQETSGQMLNVHKCTFTTANNVNQERNQIITQITGFKRQQIPLKYLGCPIFHGRTKICYFNELMDNIRNRIEGWKTNLLNQAGRLVLIKHVLQSVPIHILSAINPPKTVLKNIDKMFSNCFWRNAENKNTYHWIAWKTCCNTRKDGGLGIRKLKDILHVQSLKLCWKILTEDTLWVSFMQNKYYKEITDNNYRQGKVSNSWKRIRSVMNEAKELTIYTEEGYKWKLSKDDKFSSKNTWDFIRDANCNKISFEYIWINPIPKRISVFMWKLLHNRLPLDHNIKKKGFQFASKCSCCEDNKQENQNHLFMLSETANKVWKHFSNIIGININMYSISTYLKNWWMRASFKEDSSIIFHCLPAIICWEIWKARNKSYFEDEHMDADNIIRCVKNMFRSISSLKTRRKSSTELEICIYELGN